MSSTSCRCTARQCLAAALTLTPIALAAAAEEPVPRRFPYEFELRGWIIEGVRGGRHEKVFVDFLGMSGPARLVAADNVGVRVVFLDGGIEAFIPWEKLGAARLAAIAKKYAAPEGERLAADRAEILRAIEESAAHEQFPPRAAPDATTDERPSYRAMPAPAEERPGWRPMAMITRESLERGYYPGGEGGQWPQAICIDAKDGRFLLFGTDVGGIYRSRDGGASWEPCNVGYNPRGNCGFAIDPWNPDRALAIGANSLEWGCHGIYLTTDGAETWRHVLSKSDKGYRDFRDPVAFDPSSRDAALGGCRVAYWSSGGSSAEGPRLYKSTDGGNTWAEVPGSSELGWGWVKVHPTKGWVYVATSKGLFRSTDGGRSFQKRADGVMTGLDVVLSRPDHVFACRSDRILVSTNGGETFEEITPRGFGRLNLKQIRVSPANPSRMFIQNDEGDYNWRRYVSTDGGRTWSKGADDTTDMFLPNNNRQPMFACHPKDELKCWSFGGDGITMTTDGGKTWRWASRGQNAIMVGGLFNFNTQDPNILYISAQDYNGGLTIDGGKTWTYINMSQLGWGGSVYGGYAATKDILFAGVGGWYSDRKLRVTRNGGRTVTDTGISLAGREVSFGDPTDPNVLFCFNLRSTDQGRTWSAMSGADGVFTSNPKGARELYGRKGPEVVRSYDKGLTWQVLARLPDDVSDLAYDYERDRIYAAAGGRLFQVDASTGKVTDITNRLPADQFGQRCVGTVAVDPVDPRVVYAGGARNVYSTDVAVVRSTDAGNSWKSLTKSARLGNVSGLDGGREAIAMRVHPRTRVLYVGTGCYGMWCYVPPEACAHGSR